MGYQGAGIFVGGVWALWHLPLFLIPGIDVYGQSFLLFALAVIPLSVAMTWLYVSTEGSLFLTMLMHAAVNQTTLLFASGASANGHLLTLRTSVFGWATIALLWIGAALLLRRLPHSRGDADTTVPMVEGETMHGALTKAGVRASRHLTAWPQGALPPRMERKVTRPSVTVGALSGSNKCGCFMLGDHRL